MPRESSRDSKSSDKRKGKNKAPKRLRRKNKVNNLHTEDNPTGNICLQNVHARKMLAFSIQIEHP